jgi:anti-anti-sigma regulatory factor
VPFHPEAIMAQNFDISVEKTGYGFSLKLRGEFDATSAYELVYTIKKLADKGMRVNVNTSELKKIDPFGLEVFNKAIRFGGRNPARIVFEGHQGFKTNFANSEIGSGPK